MNPEDKSRFARYRPDYEEPSIMLNIQEDNIDTEKVKEQLGFVKKIDINTDDLINQVLIEIENKQ